ncbi:MULTISPECIES: nucleoside deaminase [unclassified Spirosoma]|uniref:nucleoside deaminase n=1 Tax=unclassified Spirosoma TaxID=2621999 RepID=UPI000962DA0D|nr:MULTISPECIES: nucleoside deaminase [unclassified Spirosoma]MBN8822950.1 nucleoside deaminase [Spirosoma sp.]OJW80133.1 MAG: tRNA-specific adenosine deaminase [Spirosoma sp. 48-14]
MPDEYFMEIALGLAEEAAESGEIPVGAVVVCRNRIIAKSRNQTEQLNDVTAHAELMAITAAEHYLGSKYLTDCTLYVTLEPCVMCAGALFWAQLSRLVIGASDPKRGYSRIQPSVLHPKTRVEAGVLAEESQALLAKFFNRLRT